MGTAFPQAPTTAAPSGTSGRPDRQTYQAVGRVLRGGAAIYRELAPEMAVHSHTTSVAVTEDNPLSQVDQFETDRELRYSAAEYLGLLRTFSGHIALGETRLNRLCDSIHRMIDTHYGGNISMILTTYTVIYQG